MRVSAINFTNNINRSVNFKGNIQTNDKNKVRKYSREEVHDSFMKGLLAGLTGTIVLMGGGISLDRYQTEKHLKEELNKLQDEFYYGDVDKYQYNIFHCNDDMIPDILLYRPDNTYSYIDVVNQKVINIKNID